MRRLSFRRAGLLGALVLTVVWLARPDPPERSSRSLQSSAPGGIPGLTSDPPGELVAAPGPTVADEQASDEPAPAEQGAVEIRGTVVDAAGTPRAGAEIRVSPFAHYGLPTQTWKTTSDATGAWRVKIGSLPVVVHAEDADEASPQVLVRSVTESGGGVRLVLRGMGEHRVRVLSAETKLPLAGVSIVQSSGESTLLPARAEQTTDAEGICVFRAPSGYSTVRYTGPLEESTGVRDPIRAGETTVSRLEVVTNLQSARLVFLLPDGMPNPFDVAVTKSGIPTTDVYARIPVDGATEIPIPLATAGELNLSLTSLGWGLRQRWADVADIAQGGVILMDLRDAYIGEVQAVDLYGQPLADLPLSLRRTHDDGRTERHSIAAERGIVVLPSGTYQAFAGNVSAGDVDVRPGMASPLRVPLSAGAGFLGGTITGPVLPDGQVGVIVVDPESQQMIVSQRITNSSWKAFVPRSAGTAVDVFLIVDGTRLLPTRSARIGDRDVDFSIGDEYQAITVRAISSQPRVLAGAIGLREHGVTPITRVSRTRTVRGYPYHQRWRLGADQTAEFLVPRDRTYEVWLIPEDGSAPERAPDLMTTSEGRSTFEARFDR